jgi:hypothetical protein
LVAFFIYANNKEKNKWVDQDQEGRREGSGGKSNNAKLGKMSKKPISNLQRYKTTVKQFNSASQRAGKGSNRTKLGSKTAVKPRTERPGKNYGKAYMSDKK